MWRRLVRATYATSMENVIKALNRIQNCQKVFSLSTDAMKMKTIDSENDNDNDNNNDNDNDNDNDII